MIHVTHTITINESEIQQEFIRASGPGGQNVNKVATAVQLRFDVAKSPSLSKDVRDRLISLARKRITEEGVHLMDEERENRLFTFSVPRTQIVLFPGLLLITRIFRHLTSFRFKISLI